MRRQFQEPTDKEASNLIAEQKRLITTTPKLPKAGCTCKLDAIGVFTNSTFYIDIHQGSYSLEKITLQERVRQTFPLLRLDLDPGRPHSNPDGQKIEGNRLHIYKMNYGHTWAYPLDHEKVREINSNVNLAQILNISDAYQQLELFLQFCKFTELNLIRPQKTDITQSLF